MEWPSEAIRRLLQPVEHKEHHSSNEAECQGLPEPIRYDKRADTLVGGVNDNPYSFLHEPPAFETEQSDQ
jgi:hypothetical protein